MGNFTSASFTGNMGIYGAVEWLSGAKKGFVDISGQRQPDIDAMTKEKRSLNVIGEFEPFVHRISDLLVGAIEMGKKVANGEVAAKDDNYLFDADTATVRGGGYKYNAFMGGF